MNHTSCFRDNDKIKEYISVILNHLHNINNDKI